MVVRSHVVPLRRCLHSGKGVTSVTIFGVGRGSRRRDAVRQKEGGLKVQKV